MVLSLLEVAATDLLLTFILQIIFCVMTINSKIEKLHSFFIWQKVIGQMKMEDSLNYSNVVHVNNLIFCLNIF